MSSLRRCRSSWQRWRGLRLKASGKCTVVTELTVQFTNIWVCHWMWLWTSGSWLRIVKRGHVPEPRVRACYHHTSIKLLSFNRNQSRVVTGLLTGHKILRRHLYLLRLLDNLLCRRCGAKEETSAHILCECEALAALRHRYLGSFFLEPDVKSISFGAIWSFSKATGLPWIWYGAQRDRQ